MEKSREKLDSLEMSKKRDRKVMITEEAIRKVPYVRYREIPEQEYDIIQSLAKRVLEFARERNDSNEVAITYSYDPAMILAGEELIGVHFGDEHSVDPLADPRTFHLIMKSQECAVVSLHNHPSLSLVSLMDIRFFLRYHSIKLLVIVTNMGSVSYLVKSSKYEYAAAIDFVNDVITMHNIADNIKGYQKAVQYFLSNCYKVGIIYEDR